MATKIFFKFHGNKIINKYFPDSLSTKGTYEIDGVTEKFTYTLSLVFIQCAVNFAYANIREFNNLS
jgi:hypothetical protein